MAKAAIKVEKGSGNVFADLGLPNPEQELLKAQLTLQIYKIVKARGLTQAQAGGVLGIEQPAGRLDTDAQPRGQFLGRAADRISDRARSRCADHREADTQGEGRDGGSGEVRFSCHRMISWGKDATRGDP